MSLGQSIDWEFFIVVDWGQLLLVKRTFGNRVLKGTGNTAVAQRMSTIRKETWKVVLKVIWFETSKALQEFRCLLRLKHF